MSTHLLAEHRDSVDYSEFIEVDEDTLAPDAAVDACEHHEQPSSSLPGEVIHLPFFDYRIRLFLFSSFCYDIRFASCPNEAHFTIVTSVAFPRLLAVVGSYNSA